MAEKKYLTYLTKFKRNLSRYIFIDKMLFFGSRVNGKPRRWSDFDLIIVSNEFKGKKSFERPVGFHDCWTIDYPVDFLCYTPEEFKKLSKQVTIVSEAVKHGIEIK